MLLFELTWYLFSLEKLNNLVIKALEGFRYVLYHGDKHLNISSSEPYLFEENHMSYYDDRTGQTR